MIAAARGIRDSKFTSTPLRGSLRRATIKGYVATIRAVAESALGRIAEWVTSSRDLQVARWIAQAKARGSERIFHSAFIQSVLNEIETTIFGGTFCLRNQDGRILSAERKRLADGIDNDLVALAELAGQDPLGKRVFNLLLD